MRCPFCGTDDTQVKDSRGSEDGASIRRRRLCSSCGSRFTTFERIQLRELIVVKRNGKKSIFDREKIVKSMEIALGKRKFTTINKDEHIIRMHIGLEDTKDIIKDIKQAMRYIK